MAAVRVSQRRSFYFTERQLILKFFTGTEKTLSGWITAFCFWSEKGTCLIAKLHPPGYIQPVLGDSFVVDDRDAEDEELYADCMRLELDGVRYHLI